MKMKLVLIILVLIILFIIVIFITVMEPNIAEAQQGTAKDKVPTIDIDKDIDKVRVMVSILPQTYFVERIGGKRVEISVMIPPGASPATYEPRPGQMRNLSRTKMYVRIFVPFENAWIDKIISANKDMLIVDSTKGIKRIQGKDPHIWLSPRLVKVQVENIYNGLVRVDTANKDFYLKNKEKFLKELDVLDMELSQILAGIKRRKFMVFHPAWSYFAADYGLEQIPIQIEGKEPSVAEMINLINTAKNNNIKIIFLKPMSNSKSAETIAKQIKGEVVFIDPLAVDWADNLRAIAKIFTKVLY